MILVWVLFMSTLVLISESCANMYDDGDIFNHYFPALNKHRIGIRLNSCCGHKVTIPLLKINFSLCTSGGEVSRQGIPARVLYFPDKCNRASRKAIHFISRGHIQWFLPQSSLDPPPRLC